ncbi:MAG TPA: type II secretion system protein GspD, partial [Leucothrix sp.]|nr:type II secretion system protein GspD [Leucothrix sp.]
VPVIGEEEEAAARAMKKGGKVAKKHKKPKKRNADELITRVIRVEHVPAAMLVPILRPLVPSTGQLQAYGPSNTIVISDRAANIDRLIKIIRRMDRADDEELEVVPLKYASAKELAQTITILQRSSIKGAASKNRIAADVRTNSLLLSGDKSSRQQVRKIIRKLDTYQKTEERTKVIYLRYAKATDLAKVLTGFSKTQKTTKATKKGAAGTQKANIDIQADDSTNSLIITAEADIQKNLEKVIRKLDVRRAQVLVEAIIAEVSADLSKNIGVQLGTGAADNGKNIGFGILSTFSSAGASFTSKGVPIPAKDGATFGFALGSNGNINFGLLVNALAGDAATNILSTPTIIALDNEEAKIVVGKNVPFLTGQFTNTGSGGSTTPSSPFQTIERKDVGLTLKIKPQINDGSSIRLNIEQEISSLSASDVSTADVVTNKRTINTSVMVEDGQVLVLGGLIEDTYTDTEQKVPLLGDLPIVGRAFRNKKTVKKKQNLMVFIHPVIMRDVLSGDEYTRQKYNKLKYAQSSSKIANRGLLKSGASVFPDNIKRDLVKKLTPAQKKQIIIREQQQRVLAYKQKIRQAKLDQQNRNRMNQQRRAANILARKRAPVVNARPVAREKSIKAMPQRLRNIVPRTKAKRPVSRFGDVFDMDSSK